MEAQGTASWIQMTALQGGHDHVIKKKMYQYLLNISLTIKLGEIEDFLE